MFLQALGQREAMGLRSVTILRIERFVVDKEASD